MVRSALRFHEANVGKGAKTGLPKPSLVDVPYALNDASHRTATIHLIVRSLYAGLATSAVLASCLRCGTSGKFLGRQLVPERVLTPLRGRISSWTFGD